MLVTGLKGGMINLLLHFPKLRPEDSLPWLPLDEVGDHDGAARTAAPWRLHFDEDERIVRK